MPTYQYTCTDCGEPLEAVQAFSDDSLTVCPLCGGSLRKVFSAVGVVFKGSGFYRTDSRNGSGKGASGSSPAPATADSAPAPTSPGGSDSSSPSAKPASGPASTPAAKPVVNASSAPSTGGGSSA